MKAKELIKKVQSKHEWSQNQVAKELGITSAALSNLAQEKTDGSDETYIKLAKMAGIDPTEIIIEKHMRKAGPEGQKIWAHLARTLPKSAALLLVIILIVPNIQAHAASFQNTNVIKCLLCKIMK
ncbi:hypothetical protein B1757_12390 [Acidithiobacillus marinus]|uniref:HTH cro/C1-type domain-containing protein n=1 Tax=Acidithiobacillus marinus TaxID=187490 RepID=A0A2I1DJL8_9PROT|nr:helix-turn-helix domain-containing protein [Acidithiobacillus marinus]PKY10071.1 hypothetical protein B1757_12390 [Acidithiobacillus marinus]